MLQSRGPSSLCLINDLAVYNGHVRLAADGGQRVCCPENKIGVLARFQAADTVGNAEAFRIPTLRILFRSPDNST